MDPQQILQGIILQIENIEVSLSNADILSCITRESVAGLHSMLACYRHAKENVEKAIAIRSMMGRKYQE